MIINLWGTRGSMACSGPDTEKYGGNTSCVEVRKEDEDTLLILDAGTGIRRLGLTIDPKFKRVNILLTHLHIDHIQGLGFFSPLFDSESEVHIYGPATHDRQLQDLLTKYLSPPLFPVLLRDLPCKLTLHGIIPGEFQIGSFRVKCDYVCHPGVTVGYQIQSREGCMTYLPDHEPALGSANFPLSPDWTSGFSITKDVDFLLHDAQYTKEEYNERVGWGHSTIQQALLFAKLANVKTFIPIHHDPSHSDDQLDEMLMTAISEIKPTFNVIPGQENTVFKL